MTEEWMVLLVDNHNMKHTMNVFDESVLGASNNALRVFGKPAIVLRCKRITRETARVWD